MSRLSLRAAALLLIGLCMSVGAADKVTFEKGDHVCLIGNCLAERMQHDGWLETLLHSRFPELELSIRNLGFSADEVEGSKRQRVQGFGSQDDWLRRCKADVVFAFFGFNESFAGEAGVEKFKSDLTKMLQSIKKEKYNGKSGPRIVLFSPIAFENIGNPNIPDGREHNVRLSLYTNAMKEVATATEVAFVDLFTTTQQLYGAMSKAKPLTINGVHLNEFGNAKIAELIGFSMFGARTDLKGKEKLRQSILDKNFTWFARYRPTDDYNIFGGRSGLDYPNGPGGPKVSNYSVLMREMEVLEVMTGNRDKVIWAAARGQESKPDDSNTPEFIPVKTNKPGKKPDGSYDYVGAEAAIEQMKVPANMKVNLFASEEMFPELQNPVQMAFDTRGRLWVAAWPNYPHWKPKTPMNDKLLILEDTNGDGKADKCTTFAGDLHDPTGFEFYNGGVLIAQAPDLMFLKDTNGDDKVDFRERLLHGISAGDSHHTASSFVIDQGGGLYFSEGVFHMSQVESIYGPVRNHNACIWRFDLKKWKVERYIAYGFANPHGDVVDYWGNQIVHDGTGAQPYHAALFSGHLDSPKQHSGPPQVYKQRTRPCAATEILSSRHFPEEMQGELLVCNVITHHGILRYKVSPDGASFAGTELEPLIMSADFNFRPADLECGPDGAIYFLDWHKPLIGHMQHHIRDPNRDMFHGRVYRITYPSRPLLQPAKIAGEPIEKLLDLLKEPEDRVRYKARLELSAFDANKVIAAVQTWMNGLDKNDKNYEHHMMEALWQHQFHNVVNQELLRKMLRANEPQARAAATRVLCYWRDQIPESLYLFRAQAEDENPLVRLEAVRACSFYNKGEAADVALLALKKPMDKYLSYTLGETMKQLDQFVTVAIAKGEPIARDNPAGAAFIMEKLPTAALLKMERNDTVNAALLSRHDVSEAARIEALQALAKKNNTDIVVELIQAMSRAEKAGGGHAGHIASDFAKMLCARPVQELTAASARIQGATIGGSQLSRSAAYAAWITADNSDENAFKAASKSTEGLSDYLASIQFVGNDNLRGSLYARVRPLMFELPPGLSEGPRAANEPGLRLNYYNFPPDNCALENLQKRKTDATGIVNSFTLNSPLIKNKEAFAATYSGTLTVSKSGGYIFQLASDDGSRMYLDGKSLIDNDGLHGTDPKRSKQINLNAGPHDIVVTYFNGRGGFALDVQWKGPDFNFQQIPAAALGAGSSSGSVRDDAIRAITNIPGHESEKFDDYSKLIVDPQRRAAAVAAIRALPKQNWSAEKAPRVIDTILAYLTSRPVSERTTSQFVDALTLGKDLASLLPADQSKALLAKLQNLNVDIVVIRPVPHQMLYDHKRFVVEASKPVEIIFENTDVMPHNLVIVDPGSLADVGMAAEAMGPAGEAKGYVPEMVQVRAAIKLLLPGESKRLSFTAPQTPGEYPFLCTFPGHWLVMNGVMEVVKDKSTAKGPEVTIHNDAPQRKFVKMWEMNDFTNDLGQPLKDRSSAKGKAMFDAAGCIKCHALKNEGGKIGPDLTKVAEKYKGAKLLEQIIDPSKEINEQYKTVLLTLKDGKRVMGLIVKESDKSVDVLTNPLEPANLTLVDKAEIQTRKPLTVSSMPTGLLVTLSKEEILDLLNYVETGGTEK